MRSRSSSRHNLFAPCSMPRRRKRNCLRRPTKPKSIRSRSLLLPYPRRPIPNQSIPQPAARTISPNPSPAFQPSLPLPNRLLLLPFLRRRGPTLFVPNPRSRRISLHPFLVFPLRVQRQNRSLPVLQRARLPGLQRNLPPLERFLDKKLPKMQHARASSGGHWGSYSSLSWQLPGTCPLCPSQLTRRGQLNQHPPHPILALQESGHRAYHR